MIFKQFLIQAILRIKEVAIAIIIIVPFKSYVYVYFRPWLWLFLLMFVLFLYPNCSKSARNLRQKSSRMPHFRRNCLGSWNCAVYFRKRLSIKSGLFMAEHGHSFTDFFLCITKQLCLIDGWWWFRSTFSQKQKCCCSKAEIVNHLQGRKRKVKSFLLEANVQTLIMSGGVSFQIAHLLEKVNWFKPPSLQ